MMTMTATPQQFKEAIENLAKTFPGLRNGEVQINGGDLVEYLTPIVRELLIDELWFDNNNGTLFNTNADGDVRCSKCSRRLADFDTKYDQVREKFNKHRCKQP